MARIFTEGAEMGDGLFWNSIDYHDYAVGIPRTGNYCYRPYYADAYKYFSDLSELYFRTPFYIGYPPGGDMFWIGYYGTYFLLFNWSSVSNMVSVYNYATSSWNWGSVTCAPSTYHILEFYLKIDDSNGVIQTRINGIDDISFSGDTKVGTNTTATEWRVKGIGQCYDDIALNSTSGSADNSWCGDGHIEYHPANGNGDTNDWTNSSGNKTNNYTYVDDIPSNSDTDYVSASAVGAQDMYNVTDYTSTNRSVRRIWAESMSKDVSLTSKKIKIGFKTGGTTYLASASTTLGSSYARVVGDVATVNPSTGLAWTGTDINAIQFVQEAE